MNTMLKNISAIARKACFTAIAVATLAASTQSASADVTIEFSPHSTDANLTKVVLKFDFNGMAPTGEKMNDIFSDDALPIVSSSDDGKDHARSFVMRGATPGESKKVVYLQTGGKVTKVEIFHKDFSVRGKNDLNSGFSWVVGDGFFAVDQTVVDKKTFEGSLYIRKPIAEIIHADALGKTITNGKVTIKSTK